MANGVQLATAYISLNVRTDDIKKQVEGALRGVGSQGRSTGSAIGSNIVSGIRNHFGSNSITSLIFAPMELAGVRWAMRAGAAIGGALKKAIMGAASLTGIGSIFAVGGVLGAGLDRLKTIQRAQVQLSLKLSPNEIQRVTDDIKKVVEGTPISLDEAFQAVPRALSAGIKPGRELNQYVQDIADAAASTGGQAGFGQIDIIFSQILGKGKLMGEELMQLTENGVDLRSALKDAFNWDDKTLNKNIAKGKVGMREVQIAVEKTWGKNGGLAKSMGKTFDGAIGNLKASIARLGANVLGAIFGDPNNSTDPLRGAIDGVAALTQKLDTAGRWVAEHKEDIRNVFDKAGNAAKWAADKVDKLGQVFGTVKQFGSDAGRWISETWNTVTGTLGRVKDKIEEVFNTVKSKFTDIFGENGWFARQFKKLGDLVDKVRELLGLGPATASAAETPTNRGPAVLPPGTKIIPGTIGPGSSGTIGGSSALVPFNSGQSLTAVPQFGFDANGNPLSPAARPGAYIGDQAILGRVKPGTYVSEPGVGDLTKGIGDCTSAIEDLVAIIEGKSTTGRSLATGTAEPWLAANGFVATDKPMPGTFQIGYFNDPNAPGGGHMQATLPGGTNFNWGDNASAANRGIGGSGAWGDPRFNKHYYKRYGNGGHIFGPGTGTSDSIPAMLSNGEHVLSASDVKRMGGQSGVYAFRNALRAGLIPGFAPGGAVDPNQLQDLQNNLADAQKNAEIATARANEVFANADASDSEKLQAQIQLGQAQRNAQQAAADYPILASGGTAPDRSLQNQISDSTDQLQLAQLQLANLPEDASYSQKLAAQNAVDQAQRTRDQSIAELNGQSNYIDQFTRSLGFIPAAAGNTGVAGTSSLAGFINMGNEVVGGLIDTGASLVQTAASAALAGTGAGPAGAAAAAYGIQAGAQTLKRISSYGFQMAGIGADALVAQLFPFGAPRWMGYDYTNFAPQIGLQQAFTTTLEKMGSDAINKHFNGPYQPPAQPTAPVSPESPEDPLKKLDMQGTAIPVAPGASGTVGAGPGINTGAVPPPKPTPSPNTTINKDDQGGGAGGGNGGGGSWFAPMRRAHGGAIQIYDGGGILKPGTLALNASKRPEKVLTEKQWASLANIQPAGRDAPLVKIDAIYGMSPDDVAQKIEAKQRLAMMRYSGRP